MRKAKQKLGIELLGLPYQDSLPGMALGSYIFKCSFPVKFTHLIDMLKTIRAVARYIS
ncbi:TPA: hypothetical protein VA066_000267 [Streptococcus agalactiae]|nr:hypothetical protein [Streptococcus agalactiae]